MNKGNLFLVLLETGSLDQGASLVRFWWGIFSGLQTTDFSLCFHGREQGSGVGGQRALLCTNPIHESTALMTSSNPCHLPRVSRPYTTAQGGGGIATYTSQDTDIQSMALVFAQAL